MSDVASPPPKEGEQEQTTHNKLLFVLFFYVHSQHFSKKGGNIVKIYPPPKPIYLNNSTFILIFAPLKCCAESSTSETAYSGRVIKKCLCFYSNCKSNKTTEKISAKEHPQVPKKHPQVREKASKVFLIHKTRQCQRYAEHQHV